jgi:hypothetical protein
MSLVRWIDVVVLELTKQGAKGHVGCAWRPPIPCLMRNDSREILARQLDTAWKLTSIHLETLTTEECLWRPAARGLHVHRTHDGEWRADWPDREDYDIGPPSIAWLTWHMGFWWSMVYDHSFGSGTLSRERVIWPGGADHVRASLSGLHDQWVMAVGSMTEEELRASARSRWPVKNRPFADIVAWANLELMKNAAEIGYARFLFAARSKS